ncbi:MAG: SGNH/GDSL hydrolase family protein [Flavobacteriaceae bacterium]|nr:SGNH/GDSL hydrolase family protein [Bacteroidia bacterium]NNK88285.1 SGNH/GDSL hydrolase family protein [Flavobacteriaceae bacterium]
MLANTIILLNRLYLILSVFGILSLGACKQDDSYAYDIEDIVGNSSDISIKILSLGDSYTKGESVCNTCGFPFQLKNQLYNTIENVSIVELEVIAETGWTTANLLSAIESQHPADNFDLVTLLIGVNNQYQGLPFSQYEIQFPQLVDEALQRANNRADKVVVLSIPDYAYTPFGQSTSDPSEISDEIDAYNDFARSYAIQRNITFLDITDITRMGLDEPTLVASDGLHPSEQAYTRFIERLLPIALEKIE